MPALQRDYPQKYYHSFKGEAAMPAGWNFVGKGAQQYVKFEPEGLRITLPAGSSPGQNQSLGLGLDLACAGTASSPYPLKSSRSLNPKMRGPKRESP